MFKLLTFCFLILAGASLFAGLVLTCPHCDLKFDVSKTKHWHYSATQTNATGKHYVCSGCKFCDKQFILQHERLPAGKCWGNFPCTKENCALAMVKARYAQYPQ